MRFVPLSEIEQQEAPSLRFVPLSEAETAPLKQTPFVPVSRNLMAQGENLRNKQPVAPVVAPVVAQPPAEPTDEELAAAQGIATLNPFIARQGERMRNKVAPVAPQVTSAVEITAPPIQYKNRTEALDDAVNLLEENQDPKVISANFAKMGITEADITKHGIERNSPYFAQKPASQPSDRFSFSENATLGAQPDRGAIEATERAFKRAGSNLRDMSTSLLLSAGAIDVDAAASNIRENARARMASAPTEDIQNGMIAIGSAKTYGDSVEAMYNHPAATFTMMVDSVLTTLPAMAPSLILGPAGAVARGAAQFVGSGASEYASVMTDVLQDKGIDLRDASKVSQALKDPKILEEIKDKGSKRGLIVGAFDGLTMGLAGRFMRPAESLIMEGNLSGNAARKATLAAWGKELSMQVGGGAGGEFAAQKATGENKPAAVLLEGLMELGTTPLEVRSALKAPSQSEILGKALSESIEGGQFTPEGIRNEALARLNPDQAQYSSTAAPNQRPQPPVVKPIPAQEPAAEQPPVTQPPVTQGQTIAALEEPAKPPIEEPRAVPKGLLRPGDFEAPTFEEPEDDSVTPVTLKEEGALPEFPTQEDNLKYYFANNKNVKQEDIVTFDDATFFKQPDGSYADVPDASKQDADVTYSSIDEIKDVIKDNFSGTTFNDFLLRPESFSELNGGKKPPKEERSVTGFVERGKAAMDSFESAVTEQFGLTVEQARTALGKLIAEKIVKINPLTGSFELKDGRFWDKEVMLRAAGVKPEEVAEVVEKKTGPDEESGPFVQHKIEDFPTFYPLVAQLKMSEDVPQFKYGANEKGVVEPLGGTFDTSGVAPIQVWVRKNGDLEVISGRHRLDLAKRSGRVTIPAQYHYESQGFDKERAAILDAEFNIRDNQGKVKDYVNYFKGAKLSREEADSRGLLAKDLGKRGYTIANEGSEELIAAHRGDAVGDEAAYLIAKNAPQDGRLQSVGIKAIQDGKSMSTAINTMQAVKALAGESQTSVDMFGFDDSAMKEADEMASIAARKQREISQRLSAITGASKNPALAKAEGIDIKDPAAVKKRIEELRQLKASWDNWSTNPDLVGEIRQERGPKPAPMTLTNETEVKLEAEETISQELNKIDDQKIKEKLKNVANNLGVKVFESEGNPRAGNGYIQIPLEDTDVEGALSPDHVFAHELGHAILKKRNMSFNGMPSSEVVKFISEWNKIKQISKDFRPEIHKNKVAKIRRHANKPDEIIADALGAFLLGKVNANDIKTLIDGIKLTDRDLGLVSKEELTLISETETEIKEREKKEKEDKATSEKAAKDAEAKEKADREKKAIADASKKADFTLTPSEEVSKAEQAEIDRKKAEQELSGQGGMFDEEEKTSPIARIKDRLIRFASGMTAIKDLVNGAYARSGHANYGIGVDVGLLSENGIKELASAILNWDVHIFVDSGAFSNFTKTIKGKNVKPLNFDNILDKYDQILDEIGNQNEVQETDYPRPMFVMPDIVGNQSASIELIKKYKNRIELHLTFFKLQKTIIPIQKGELSLADAYKEIVSILGSDNFIVGIPSAEAAVSKDELAEFLKEVKPKQVHFLGSAADSKLNPKIAIVAQYSPDTDVTADASKVRSAILNGVAEGKTREQAITDALLEEGDQGYLLGLWGPKEEKAVETKAEEREPVRGDRFKDGKGNEFEVWSSRQGSVEAHPVVDGKPVVNRGSLQLWAISDVARARFPDRRTDYFSIEKETKEPYTKEQREDALAHAKETGGEVVWQKGEYALIRGYSVLSGDPVYVPTMSGSRGRVDISSYTGKQIPDDIKAEMIKEKERLEKEAANKHEKKPFITFGTFSDGVALSKDIPSKIVGVIQEWKKLLNLEPNIYVSTIDDAQENKFNFTGPHRRIGSGTLDANERGSMRRMSDGSYYILFTKSTSITRMLEVIAHEMGHLHQKQFFDNATTEEKEALRTAHSNWLEKQKGKTAQELVTALRARTTGKTTPVPEGKMADSLGAYWKSFGEWYADQTARWAVSSEKPVSIVEFYFRRLGTALRKFYQSLKAQKYLPDETFKQYIEAATRRPANLAPGGDEASLMQRGFDFEEESDATDKIAAENPVESKALNEMDQLPTAKKKLPPGRSPELAAAAQMVKDGTMTSAQFDSLANKYKPIYIFTEPLVPATIEKMVDALTSTQSKQVNPKILNGTAVGLRLDIPAFNRKGVYVVSIHEKGTKAGSGKIIGYGSAAKAINVKFGLGNQNAALNIAAGEAKKPLQTIEGSYVSATPEQIYEQAKSALIDPAWTQIGINPTRHSYFYDRRTTVPVVAADEVLQIGNMVLGKNVTFGKKEDFLFNIDSQPAMSAGELEQRNADIRREQISEYAGIRRQMMSAVGKVAEGEVSTDLQRRLQSLIGRSRDLKTAIVTTTPTRTSPETFLAKALSEYDAGNISADVLAVVQTAYNRYPQLLDGMRLSVKAPGKGEGSASARFVHLARIVRLFKSTSGVNDPVSIRHEIAHSLEQMMSGIQRQVVFDAWIKDLQNAVDKNKDEAHQKFFHAVINFIENPTEVNHRKAIALLPSYEMYQYVNPSEYWAVNAEKLMAKQLGTAWQRFKLFAQRMLNGLKSIFGFNNNYAVHKVFNQIMSGEMNRISRRQLVDMVTGDEDFITFNNLQDDMDLLEKYNRPKTPMMGTSSLKKNILSAASKTKAVFKQGVEDPKSLGIDTINLVDRGTIYLRNKNVWFGSGLDTANFSRYEGQMRDTNGIVNSSIALDNAIRSGVISTQVIMQGGIKYDPNTMNYVAQKRSKGMAGVYKAESVIKKRLGDQLGTDIIQGYLEAKRSLSIRNELDARQDQVDQLKDDLLNLQSTPGADPADIDALKTELAEARKSLTSIKLVERKVSMSNEEIQEFLDRETEHPELRDIMDNWNAVNQNMLNFWFDVGLFSEARYELLSNIKDYIPWYRIMEDGSVSSDTAEVKSKLQSTTRSMTNIGKEKIFKAGKPSVTTEFVAKNGQQTFKIQPSTVVSVEINGNPVNPNDVTASPNGEVRINAPIAEGDIVEFKTNREIQNMIDNMTRNVMRMTMNGLRQYASNRIVADYATRNQRGQIRVYPKVDKENGRFNYVSNGRNIVVEIKDPLIAEAIFGLENLNIEMFKGLAAITNFVRRSITLSGAFQIKQVFKDAPTAAWVTGVKRPDLLIGGVYKGFVTSLLRPLANQLGKKITGRDYDIEPVIEILTAAGIGGFHSPSRTPEAEIKMQIGLMNRNVFSFVLKGLDHIGDSSDMSQRVATYKRVLAETGDEAQALYQAANVINFLHHGSAQHAQAIVKLVPFMSAWANSLDVLVQSLAGGGLKGKSRAAALKQIAITGAALATSTLLYCMLVGGDDEYEKLDDQTKLRGYMIPGTEIMLPMNTSAGFLFKVLPELLYNKFVRDSTETPQDATRLWKALREAAIDMILGPSPVAAAVKPVVEIVIKRDFFTGKSVVPAGLEKVEAAQQYTATTSELGKMLSAGTGTDKTRLLNPIEADHIIKGLFGSVGALAMWASNLIGEAAEIRPEMTSKQTPFIGAFLRPEVPRGPEDLFYDLADRVESAYATAKNLESKEKYDELDKYIEKNEGLLGLYDSINEAKQTLGEINNQIRYYGTTVDKTITPKERSEEIKDLKEMKNEMLEGIGSLRKDAGL